MTARATRNSGHSACPRVVLLDNLDSFTFNLAHQLEMAGAEVLVRRAAEASPNAVIALAPTHIVLSPGPLRPDDHPANAALLTRFAGVVPILGVCLGMQAINGWCDGTLRRTTPPVHGKTSDVQHNANGLFAGAPQPMRVARYHSLVVDRLGDALEATAWLSDGTIMAVQHGRWPLYGVQFHPESFLTVAGDALVRNFLRQRGQTPDATR